MGFFKDFKRDFAQAVNELMPDKDELANEYDDEDMVNTFDDNDDLEIAPEDMLENIDDIGVDFEETDNLSKFEGVQEEKEDTDASSESDEETLESIPNAEIINGQSDIDVDAIDVENPEAGSGYDENIVNEVFGDNHEIDSGETVMVDLDESKEQEELGAVDENASLDALDDENMLENVDDALRVEPENVYNAKVSEQGLDELNLDEALMVAIKKHEDEKESNGNSIIGVDDDMEDNMAEALVEEEMLKERESDINSVLSDDTTYITKGTKIVGNIETDGGIDVIGSVEGNVSCGGKLIIGGNIKGSIKAGEIYANAAKLEGDVNAEGSVKIGVGSVVIGNVYATSAVVAGAVNGDIDVHGPVIVDSTAVIMGNIKSKSVQINNGAVIEGFCSQCYAEIDVKSFFD